MIKEVWIVSVYINGDLCLYRWGVIRGGDSLDYQQRQALVRRWVDYH